MPALDAALALAENLDVAVLVGQHLKFDVPRRADEFLQIDVGGTERRAGFLLRLGEQIRAVRPALCTMRMPRPPPPADAFRITG